MRKFFLNEITTHESLSVVQHKASGVRVPAVGILDHKTKPDGGLQFRQARKSRVYSHEEAIYAADFPSIVTNQNFENRDSRLRVPMASKKPRPTRFCNFVWKPKNKTLHITLGQDNRRSVKWAGVNGPTLLQSKMIKSKVGPHVDISSWVEAQVLEASRQDKVVDGPSNIETHQMCVGETSHSKLDSLESERCDPGSGYEDVRDGWQPDVVNLKALRCDGGAEIGQGDYEVQVGSLVLTPCVEGQADDWASILTTLVGVEGNQLALMSMVVEPDFVDLPLILFGGLEDEGDQSTIYCEPLCQILPTGSSLLAIDSQQAPAPKKPTKWSDNKMSGFSKYVGFPIDEFEEKCLALFQRIEESEKLQRKTATIRKITKSSTKGTRELRNLDSSMNYERKQLCC